MCFKIYIKSSGGESSGEKSEYSDLCLGKEESNERKKERVPMPCGECRLSGLIFLRNNKSRKKKSKKKRGKNKGRRTEVHF